MTDQHPYVATIRHELRMRMLRVVSLERPTPRLIRVGLAGDDLAGFVSSGPAGHVKVFVPEAGSHRAEVPTLGPRGIVGGHAPTTVRGRDYTPRHRRLDEGLLELDIVLHSGGVVSGWAERAAEGDILGVAGPRGSHVLRPEAEPAGYVLAGDETALPAIANWLRTVRLGVPVQVVVEVTDADDHQPLETDGVLDAHWIHRRGTTPGAGPGLVDAVRSLPPLEGRVWHWAAAEASIVPQIRQVWLDAGTDPDLIEARGYWRRGVADHQEPHTD